MRRIICFTILLAMVLFPAGAAHATDEFTLQELTKGCAAYMLSSVPSPLPGSIGGDWAVLGLARDEAQVPSGYFETYYQQVETKVAACEGILHRKKYTEYSRTIVAMTAIGKDPSQVAGYNLLEPLGDYEKTICQGLNGPIWALIALDSGEYSIPANPQAKTQATRQLYVDAILAAQLDDGGFNLTSKGSADPDMTAMALQALAKYTEQERVADAVVRALDCLSSMQNGEGGFSSWGTENSESTAQVIVALCELGVGLEDRRFVKNGHTVLDALLGFRKDDGSFTHVKGGADGSNQMASEQAYYAFVAAKRMAEGKSSLYRMTDSQALSLRRYLPLFYQLRIIPDEHIRRNLDVIYQRLKEISLI